MIGNMLGVLVLVALVALFVWLARRAWRARNPILKWVGVVFTGLFALLFTLLTVFALIGFYKLYVPRSDTVANIKVAGTAEEIARGEHLANAFCTGCHSLNDHLPLSGGDDVGKQSPVPIGMLVAPNLTPGGRLKDWSDGEIFRAIRHALDREGRPMVIMSAVSTHNLSDDDIQAVIALLRSQPAVQNETPPESPNFLFALFMGAGLVPQPAPISGQVVAPPKGPTSEYGNYIVSYVGCRDCHGANLSGGSGGLTPAGPNLAAIVPSWTQEQFIRTMRTGVNPGGHALNPNQMPWKSIGRLDDVELAALYEYLSGLNLRR